MLIRQRSLHRLPVSWKLTFLLWVFVATVVGLLALSCETIFTLSATRAYVGGEGLWSKSQKKAVGKLLEYAVSRAPQDFEEYLQALQTPLGDKQARLELEKPNPDPQVVYEGFVRGRNRPEDVNGMAKLFRRFRHTKYMNDAVEIWSEGDQLIERLQTLGNELHAENTARTRDEARIHELTLKVEQVNNQLTPLEDRFSYALGEGARWTATSFLLVVGAAALLSILMGVALTLLMLRHVRQTDERYKHLIDIANDGILLFGANDGCIVETNEKGLELLRVSRTEILGKSGEAFCAPDSREQFGQMLRRTMIGENVTGMNLNVRRSDGRIAEVEVNTSLTELDGEKIVQGIFRDVSERRRLEEEVRQAQKLEVIGRLAGGLAHDFNNLLMVISTQVAKLADIDYRPKFRSIETIQSAVVKATSITRQLLALGRKQVLQFELIDLNDLIRGAKPILSALTAERVELRLDLLPQSLPIRVDPGKIEQVLFNLTINACEAMVDGGVLSLRTSHEGFDVNQEGAIGHRALLEVIDNGRGMDSETTLHIFEPFFSKKNTGEGTGLGLSIVYGILKQSGGSVEVQSELGKGTTFRIRFPLVRKLAQTVADPQGLHARRSSSHHSETILLAEDQGTIRTSLREGLESEGYTVLEAKTGIEALRIAEDFPGRIDALVTDLIMPSLRGSALAREVTRLHTNTAVIFMSGYSEEAFLESGLLGKPNVALLQKPFDLDVLSATVRMVLDHRMRADSTLHDRYP